MVAADARSEDIDSSDSGNGDLPRAGELMAGLKRQSQTLAVYLGLEDAPDLPPGETRPDTELVAFRV